MVPIGCSTTKDLKGKMSLFDSKTNDPREALTVTNERNMRQDDIPSPFQFLILLYVKIISNFLPLSSEYGGLCTMEIVILWNSNCSHYGTCTVPVPYGTVRCGGFFGGVECPRCRVNNVIYVCIPYRILDIRILYVYISHYTIMSSRYPVLSRA